MKKFLLRFFGMFILLAAVVVAFRLFTPEDARVCEQGQWIMHGHPADPMPTESCNPSVDLSDCVSYYDGCNTCFVSGGSIGGCTKMYCEIVGEPKCLEYVTTGVDLTRCLSYYDGCNTCSVVDGRVSACTLMYCETPGEAKCIEYTTGTDTGSVGIANPASTYCIDHGGSLDIVTQDDSSQLGMCTLPDGTVCEERAYMRGECKAKEAATVCTMEYAPVCAKVHVQCIKAPCDPILQTFGNVCVMKANSLAEYLYDGECRTDGEDLSDCISYYDGCNTCGVENGKVTMCTLMYCEVPGEAKCLQYK